MMSPKQASCTTENENPMLDIASLIDVCFLLLIYFIATTTIVPAERDLNMKLPVPREGLPLGLIEPLLIRIEPNGQILTGTQHNLLAMDSDPTQRELPLLDSHLAMMRDSADASGGALIVQIEASDECRQQRVIDVLNALAKAKISTVTFRDLVSDV